ncbi:MAG: DUF2344 domain-containing protein [Caldilineaceae bacterium]
MSPSTKPPITESTEIPRQRVRILYEKGEAVKFISHLDEFRLWGGRCAAPICRCSTSRALTHSRTVQFASPLGVGFTGMREPIDITFSPPLPLAELRKRAFKISCQPPCRFTPLRKCRSRPRPYKAC